MSNRKLRSERNCLNCGSYVEDRFCSHCGQENIINRPSFYYLFSTFFKDLVNYDSNFWQTISILFFKPGAIVNQYLAGKRSSYVSPIKLYFFISLFTFLLPYNLINSNDSDNVKNTSDKIKTPTIEYSEDSIKTESLDTVQNSALKNKDSIEDKSKENVFFEIDFNDNLAYAKANTIKEFDSIHNALPAEEKMKWMKKLIYRKNVELIERDVARDGKFQEVFIKSFKRNFSRVLIIYLPVFAFVLWIFHEKRKWKYYDHGVFTLYYFSFLLLLIFIIILFEWLIYITQSLFSISWPVVNTIGDIFYLSCLVYVFFYFFRSHRRIYKESKLISHLKSFFIFGINFILFTFILLMYTVITFLMM